MGGSRKRSASGSSSGTKKTKRNGKMWKSKKKTTDAHSEAMFEELSNLQRENADDEDDYDSEVLTMEGAFLCFEESNFV
jgi:hypothetical protein